MIGEWEMAILTIICLCGNSFIVTENILNEALKHPTMPFIYCNQLAVIGGKRETCKRKYSATELKKYIGKLDIIEVKEEKDIQLEILK